METSKINYHASDSHTAKLQQRVIDSRLKGKIAFVPSILRDINTNSLPKPTSNSTKELFNEIRSLETSQFDAKKSMAQIMLVKKDRSDRIIKTITSRVLLIINKKVLNHSHDAAYQIELAKEIPTQQLRAKKSTDRDWQEHQQYNPKSKKQFVSIVLIISSQTSLDKEVVFPLSLPSTDASNKFCIQLTSTCLALERTQAYLFQTSLPRRGQNNL
ncbi:hypothetical protein HDV02_002373 [Globomyces sp. JEL0801]|nr:hypothetical protein HDV02_002373 [Globomyces sp. JEL0801]